MTIKPELNSRPNVEGKYAVFIRLTHNRKVRRISTGIFVKNEDWNPEKREVRRSNVLYVALNSTIKAKIIEAEHEALQTQLLKKPVSAHLLQKKLRKEVLGDSFVEYAQKRVDNHLAITTRETQQYSLNKFKAFLKNKDLLFVELEYDLIKDYERSLKRKGNAINTIHKELRFLRATYNEAIRSGAYQPAFNVFSRIQFRQEKTNRRKLSVAELGLVERIELKPKTVAYNARAAFMLSFYLQGMRVSDLLQLCWGQIEDNRSVNKAGKTKKNSSKKLPPQAMAIIDYFKSLGTAAPKNYVLPFLKLDKAKTTPEDFRNHIESMNSAINNELYDIADRLEIKRFSIHTARHTFADIAIRKSNGNIHAVSDALNHSSISITEAYFNSATRDENDALGDLVFGN